MKVTKQRISDNNVNLTIKMILRSLLAMDVTRLTCYPSCEISITKSIQESEQGASEQWYQMRKLKRIIFNIVIDEETQFEYRRSSS